MATGMMIYLLVCGIVGLALVVVLVAFLAILGVVK